MLGLIFLEQALVFRSVIVVSLVLFEFYLSIFVLNIELDQYLVLHFQIHYSLLKLFTGFATAAFIAW